MANDSELVTRSIPFGDSARPLTGSWASASSLSSVLQRCKNSWPASVNQSRRVLRSISRTASRSSSALRWRLAAAFDIRSASAALERLPSSAVLENTSSCSKRSIFANIGKETCKFWSLFPIYARQDGRKQRKQPARKSGNVGADQTHRDVAAARGDRRRARGGAVQGQDPVRGLERPDRWPHSYRSRP